MCAGGHRPNVDRPRRVAGGPPRRYLLRTVPPHLRSGPGPARRPARLAPLALAAGLALATGLAACGAAEPPAPPTTCPLPAAVAAPTFTGHVLPALRSSCGAGNDALSCHGDPSPAGHVSFAVRLSAHQVWSQLVGVEPANAPTGAGWKRVAAFDPAHSWLLEKVTQDDPGGAGQAAGNRMPYGLPNLCAPTVQTFRAWISQGALED